MKSRLELAATELLERRESRKDFLTFCRRALRPLRQEPAKHHRLLCSKLQQVATGEIRKLMVFMPPGSAKSTYTSKLFPVWFLGRAAGTNLIGASATAELATKFSREAQAFAREDEHGLGYKLVRENVDLWTTDNGGQYRAAGIGGLITGFRADLALIDDPVKDRADADSDAQRESTWNWYTSALTTRLKPGGRIVLIMTRWHEDDLGGRLLATQRGSWDVLSLPATAGESDPLGRRPGQLLWDDDPLFPYAKDLREKKGHAEQAGAMRDWYSLYEQDPRPLDGGIFDSSKLTMLEPSAVPVLKRVLRGWDLAATAQTGTRDPDWTVGVKIGVTTENRYVVLDVFRDRGGPAAVEAWLRSTAEQDGRGVRISIPQDPGQAGKMQIAYLARRLSGFAMASSPETGSKETRAMPLAAQINAGNVALQRGNWNAAFIEELRGFPSGTKDDQVDAASRAFNALTTAGAAARSVQMSLMGR